MQVVTDLHSHSKYSRAVSSQMVLPVISEWSLRKGIDIVGTGDFTHPLWFKELEGQLEEVADGLYSLKLGARGPAAVLPPRTPTRGPLLGGPPSRVTPRTPKPTSQLPSPPLFLLSTEVAAIFSQGGRTRRIHLLIFAPSFSAVRAINRELTRQGANLFSDGRPMLDIHAKNILELVLGCDPRCLVIPAHVWTPWFSLYGSMSGFDSIGECFGDLAPWIFGIETGLSSDPAMNWRIADLQNRAILSFSDAHSPAKLGRELTVFELEEVSFENIRRAIMGASHIAPRISFTLEFYPEEGKYHYTGHRNCGVRQTPEETKEKGVVCPVCRKPLTVGVMHRVQQLSGMSNFQFQMSNDQYGVRWIESAHGRPKYAMLVPLLEILSESIGSLVSSQKVINEYNKLTDEYKNEMAVLLRTKPEEIERVSGPKIRAAVEKVRNGDIFIDPGFDGVFGKVKIWGRGKVDEVEKVKEAEERQIELF